MKRFMQLAVALTAMAVLVAGGVATAAEVEGTVKSVEGQIITLEDGTTLTLDPGATVDRQALMPGSEVKASYEDKDGNKMETSIEVRQPSSTAPSTSPSSPPATTTPPADRPTSDKPSSEPSTPSSPPTTR